MPGATSPWRVNDVVLYERMREAATILIGRLTAAARSGGSDADVARAELAELHHQVATVDAYDRAAIDALAGRIDRRISEQASEPR